MAEHVRLRYGASLRGRFPLARLPASELAERKRRLRGMAARLARAGKHAEALAALTEGAAAKTGEAFAAVERAVDELLASSPAPTREPKTFRDVALLWTSGELHRRYPDRVPAKVSRALDRARAAALCETIGDVPLRRFTVDTAERALSRLPKRARMRSTRRQYAQIIGRVLKLAVFPCRVIEHSPIPAGWMPRLSTRRAFTFLYPAEEERLMRCADIPLERRLLYGLLAREGLRLSEALRMTWDTIDTTHRVLRLDRNKTSRPRAWKLAEDVSVALQHWGAKSRAGKGGTVFHASVIDRVAAARVFRADLALAGIKRPELFERSEQRSPIRAHDLRATFITLALAAGRTETWVMDRTGHTTSSMLNGYRRQARHAAELELGWFGPLDALLGLGQPLRKTARKKPSARAEQSSSKTSPGDGRSRTSAISAAPAISPVRQSTAGPAATDVFGHIEATLAEALRAATAAGEWAVVAELARELAERRRERTTSDVPSLELARAKRTRQR